MKVKQSRRQRKKNSSRSFLEREQQRRVANHGGRVEARRRRQKYPQITHVKLVPRWDQTEDASSSSRPWTGHTRLGAFLLAFFCVALSSSLSLADAALQSGRPCLGFFLRFLCSFWSSHKSLRTKTLWLRFAGGSSWCISLCESTVAALTRLPQSSLQLGGRNWILTSSSGAGIEARDFAEPPPERNRWFLADCRRTNTLPCTTFRSTSGCRNLSCVFSFFSFGWRFVC